MEFPEEKKNYMDCKCKKSQCLKRYCECFGNGLYCLNSCRCYDCYNSLDYEDTVEDERKKIESREPKAFSRKIVNYSPTNITEEIKCHSPRPMHITGCNCRKSKCLQFYCECLKAKVGCSENCRCQSCENPFGKRTGMNMFP